MTLARWLARKAEQDRKARKEANDTYLILVELMKEAWDEQKRMKLARKAVIAEIRERGGKVNSIAPAELRKLIAVYLKEHPEESVIKTFGCY